MITITNKRNYSEVSSDTKYVHKLNTDTYYKKGIEIGTVTEDMFEEVDEIPTIASEEEYKQTVRELVREKYALEDEIAIHRQKDTKPEEFEEYYAFCEKCKDKAKEVVNNKYNG